MRAKLANEDDGLRHKRLLGQALELAVPKVETAYVLDAERPASLFKFGSTPVTMTVIVPEKSLVFSVAPLPLKALPAFAPSDARPSICAPQRCSASLPGSGRQSRANRS